MADIFIAYRRDDSGDITGRIYDRLVAQYGQQHVFRDVTSLQGGQRFPARLENAISEQTVMLVIIGQRWLALTKERRDDPNDFGRIEIEIALRQRATIIPVLVQGATMPTPEDLPASISDLASYHSITVRADPDFTNDVEQVRRAVGVYARIPRQRVPWLAIVSAIVLIAIIGGFAWRFGNFGRAAITTKPSPTATATAAPLTCLDAQGNYPDPFKSVTPGNNPDAISAPGISGQNINVGGGGDPFSAFATARVKFDAVNGTCTHYSSGRVSNVASITPLVSNTLTDWQIAVTDVGLNEIRPLQTNMAKLQNTRLGVMVNIMVVSKNIAAHVKNLTRQQLAAIYQDHPTVTNWSQLSIGGPDASIDALWPGTAATLPSTWPTAQADLDTITGPLVAFRRNVLANGNANSALRVGFSKQDLLNYVASHDNAIGFTTLESWLFYANDQAGALPIAIDGIAPVTSNGVMSPTIKNDINAGRYIFWDMAHAYMSSTFVAGASSQAKADQTMINEITSQAFADVTFANLGWVYLGDVAKASEDCYDAIDICPSAATIP